jgi:aminopeptidase N
VKANWAKPPTVDFVHIDLEVTAEDVGSGKVGMREELLVRGIREQTGTIELDGPSPRWAKVRSIGVTGRRMVFVHRNEQLSLDIDPPLKRGEELTLSFEYDLTLGGRPGAGLILVPGDNDATPPLQPMVYSQGQAELNHLWFFCHDFPNERMTSAVTARVPKGVTVISNGTLEGIEEPAGAGLQAWKWRQNQPHAAYLISVAMGTFERVELPSARGAGVDGRDVPVEAYVEPGKGAIAKERMSETGAMIEFFARQFDEPYPFDKYAQTTVRAFAWGGMENSSATTLTDAAVQPDAPADPTLISHELAHQWFGDLVTCRTWEHVWLNEGWATYAESLWSAESALRRGEDVKAAYLTGLVKSRVHLAERYAREEGSQEPLASNVYADPDDTFEKADDPYAKGAWVLHMLHARLGDEAFWRGTREYLNRWKYREVETGDFRRCLEEASGDALDRFFADWVYRYGMPRIEVQLEPVMEHVGTEGGFHTRVRLKQSNPVGGPRGVSVPVVLVGKDGRHEMMIELDGETWEDVVTTEFGVERGEVDPDATVLANWKLEGSAIPLRDTCGKWVESTKSKH